PHPGLGPDRHRNLGVRQLGRHAKQDELQQARATLLSDRLDHACFGAPMIARVRSRVAMIATSPEASSCGSSAAGRLLVSSRQACSVLIANLATPRMPG